MSKRKTSNEAANDVAEKEQPIDKCEQAENVCPAENGEAEQNGFAAENVALKAEIALLRGELDAMKMREGELVRELDERRTPDYSAIAADETFADEYAVRSELIKRKVITDYLRSLSKQDGIRLLGENVGKSALAPLKKPKTLSEAKQMAELYIKD